MDHGKAKVAAGGLTLGALLLVGLAPHCSRGDYIATVTDKERVVTTSTNKDGHTTTTSKYLVFTELDNGQSRVFQNTDSFVEGKWNSSDFQGRLKKGERFKIEAYGWRIPFLSSYENIVGVKPMSHRTQDRGNRR